MAEIFNPNGAEVYRYLDQGANIAGAYYSHFGLPMPYDVARTGYDIAMAQFQNAYNERQAELAFQREKELIAAQNEYNSPANQLKRYMDAGLNPSMIYGQVTPGLQSGTASYNAPKSAEFKNSVPGSTEKINRVLNVVSTLGSLFSGVAGIASNVANVKNQNLQNQILEAQLPAVQAESTWKSLLANARNQLYHNTGEFNKQSIESLGDFGKVLFPEYYRGEYTESRSNYQNWWNNVIAPIYKDLQEGKKSKTEAESKISEYNSEMLNVFPPAVRPVMAMIFQVLGLAIRKK